jgi:hypothetical protein
MNQPLRIALFFQSIFMTPLYTLDPTGLQDQQVLWLRDQAIAQIQWARQYSLQLIESIQGSQWYDIPSGQSSHLAWQVGHLAVAQYGLMLFRQRGRAEGDIQLMPGWLRKQFGRGSQPSTSLHGMPSSDELMQHLNAIHHQSINEASQLTVQTLREPCDVPYCVYPIRLGALMMAPVHEGIHAGQIGAIRRGLGLEPIR